MTLVATKLSVWLIICVSDGAEKIVFYQFLKFNSQVVFEAPSWDIVFSSFKD